MKLGKAIEAVCDAEAELADQLRTAGERHAAEHDLYHLGHTLARICAEHVRRLEPFAERYGAKTDPGAIEESSTGMLEALRHKTAELLGRSETTGLLLMHDLRQLYLTAQATEIAWTILVQATRAARDGELLEVAAECQNEAELCGKWARTRIKESAAQVYATA
jgi:hypothetical protein